VYEGVDSCDVVGWVWRGEGGLVVLEVEE